MGSSVADAEDSEEVVSLLDSEVAEVSAVVCVALVDTDDCAALWLRACLHRRKRLLPESLQVRMRKIFSWASLLFLFFFS